MWRSNRQKVFTKRPIGLHVGNSFVAQDILADTLYSATAGNVTAGGSTNAGWSAVGGIHYTNALLQCAFDYLIGTVAAAQVYNTLNIPLVNGMYGASGKQFIGEIEHAIIRIAQIALSQAGGAKIYMFLTLFENDLNNNDVAGYHAIINRKVSKMLNILIDMGITPVVNTPAPSTFINTATKSDNWYKVRDYVLNLGVNNRDFVAVNVSDPYRDKQQANGYPWPLSYASDAEAVALNGNNFGAANAKKYSLFNRHADAVTGGGLHPNARAQVIRSLAAVDALQDRVTSASPFSIGNLSPVNITENSDFEATAGTAVAGGTNVNAGASVTFKGFQRNSFGANSEINVTDFVDTNGAKFPKVDIYPTTGAHVSDNAGLTSTALASALSVPGTTVARYFEDVEIVKAKNVLNLSRGLRITGANFTGIGLTTGAANDISDSPSDNQLGWRNHVGLLEGKRLVLSSFPFYLDPAPQNTVRNIGGCTLQTNAPFTALGAADNSGMTSIVRAAGLKLML